MPNHLSLHLPCLSSDFPCRRSMVGGHFQNPIHRRLASRGLAVSLPYPCHASSSRRVRRPSPQNRSGLKVVWEETRNRPPLVTSAPHHHDVTSASTRRCPVSPPPRLLASSLHQHVLYHVIACVSCHVTLPYPLPAR